MTRRLFLALLCTQSAFLTAATVTWDGGGDGTSWNDAANWVGGAVPATTDDVIIDIAGDPVIQVTGALTVRSLNCEEDLSLSNKLTLTGGSSLVKITDITNRSIFASGGAVVEFPLLTTVRQTSNTDIILEASGAGTRLVFPNVATIEGRSSLADDLFVRALDGGRVEFPLATQAITGAVAFSADGTNSAIDLASLTTFDGYFNATSSGFATVNGGSINIPVLTSIVDGDLDCDAPGLLDLDQLTNYSGNGAMTLTGGVHDLSELATFHAIMNVDGSSVPLLPALNVVSNASIFVSGGAVLQLPLVTVIANAENRANTLEASGAGSRLVFANVTSINGRSQSGDDFFIRAVNGGSIEFPLATQAITGAVAFTADGINSSIDLASLATFDGYFNATSSGFAAVNGGSINLPALTSIVDGDLDCDTPGLLDLDQLTNYSGNGAMTLTGGVHDLSGLTTFHAIMNVDGSSVPLLPVLNVVSNASIFVSGGAVLQLPLVTVIANAENRDNTLEASGAGSRLVFANVTSINGRSQTRDDFFVRAVNGGSIEFPLATQAITGAVAFTADGTNSSIDLASLATFDGYFNFTNSGFEAVNGGAIITPALTSIHTGNITCDAPGALDLDQLASFSGGGDMILTGGVHDLSALTTAAGVTLNIAGGSVPLLPALNSIDNSDISLSGGAVLALPLVTSITNDADTTLSADGAGAQLEFPNLTTITASTSSAYEILFDAAGGAVIDLSGVTLIENSISEADQIQFIADGTGSLIDLSDLSEIGGSDAQFFESNGGVIHTPGLSGANLPDLTPIEVTSAGTLTPGSVVSLTWNVKNNGGVAFDSTRRDSIFFATDALGTDAIRVENFQITSVLAPAATEVITRDITVPTTGFNGAVYVIVKVDDSLVVIEPNEDDNSVATLSPVMIPATITFNINRDEVHELQGGIAKGHLSRNGDLAAPLTVSLAASPAGQVTIPATATFGGGRQSVSFNIVPIDDETPDGDILVNITAQTAGYATGSDSLVVLDGSIPALSLAVDNTAPTEGGSVLVTVARNHASDPLSASFSSSLNGQVDIAGSVDFLVAETTKQVTLTVIDDDIAEQDTLLRLVANAPGHVGGQIDLTLIDNDRPSLSISLNRSIIPESAPSGDLLATITRSPASTEALVVGIASSDSGAFEAIATTFIAANQTSVTIPLTPIDNEVVDGPRNITVWGQALEASSGALLVESPIAALEISDDDGPTLTAVLAKEVLVEGSTSSLTITRNLVDPNPLAVTLSHDGDTRITLPASVTIPANEDSVTLTLSSSDNATSDGSSIVAVTAAAPTFATGYASFTLTDEALPELLVTRLIHPSEVNTNEVGAYTYRIENQGAEAVTRAIEVQVWLSRDQSISNDDIVVSEYLFDGDLPSGLYFERTESFVAPQAGGDYYLIARVDAQNLIGEVVETNNFKVSSVMRVVTAYDAIVSTDINVATAGTEVPLSGTSTYLDNTPAALELVNIHVKVRESVRVISALTNSNGEFSAVFRPLPGEAGAYTIGASHPGVPESPDQDSFTLLGFQVDPGSLSKKLVSDDSVVSGSFTLANLADVAQSGISFELLNAPAGITANFTPVTGDSLAALADTTVDYTLSASAGTASGTTSAALRITSVEGGTRQIGVAITVCENTSRLVVLDRPVKAGMFPGEQSFVNFTVRNDGGAPTGPVDIVLPSVPWMSSAVASPLPSLAPDEEIELSLQLCPAADLPLTVYTGAFVLSASDSNTAVPYEFRALSDSTGDLVVNCEDEYTYYAANRPPLAGAVVSVIDAINGQEVATGTSDAGGVTSFSDLNEGYYDIVVRAEKHATFRETIFLNPGTTNTRRAFLSRQAVEYIWKVIPTAIQDRYRIVVESVFETNVPIPVVVVEPSYIDFQAITQEVTQIDLSIRNEGLIAAEEVTLNLQSSAEWSVTALATELGDLPANSALTVPLIIRDLRNTASRSGAPRAGAECVAIGMTHKHVCGHETVQGLLKVATNSECSVDGGGTNGNGGGGGGGGTASSNSGSVSTIQSQMSCSKCVEDAIIECLIGYIPYSGIFMCPYSIANSGGKVDAAQAGLTCNCSTGLCNTVNCFVDIVQCAVDAIGGAGGAGGARSSLLALPVFTEFQQRGRDLMAFIDFQMVTFGDEAWRELLDDPDLRPLADSLLESMEEGTEDDRLISAAERAQALATTLGTAEPALVGNLIDRLNRTTDYYGQGIYEVEDLTAGMNDDFITRSSGETAAAAVVLAFERAIADGFQDPLEAYLSHQDELFKFLTEGDGVCAKVRLRIEQDAVMTRDAFEASLEIINSDSSDIENLTVDIRITDVDGVDSTALFGVVSQSTGAATIGQDSSATWAWSIIPTSQAAPTESKDYYVQGSVHYMQDGEELAIPLSSQPITVLPTPSLAVKYFHQRDVFSDDPHTPEIEPSIPFSLGVMVSNDGAGVARDLTITSSQPEIVDNEKGLFIDFDIIATEVAGQALTPSLTADFGDFQPSETKVGHWLITSTLQGLFTDYEASFEHLDSLGDERLSLIESVTIHETIHTVSAPGIFDDGLPDFLTNDVPDFGDFPDTVHLSDGSVAPVTPVGDGSAPAPSPAQLQVTLNVNAPSGWIYVRLDDPADGAYRLTSVVRSDGRVLPLDVNAWVTDRIFIGVGQQPVRQNRLHLFDHDSTGSYTLTYEALPIPDTQSPSSMVESLPTSTGGFFEVNWSGSDDTEIVSYDIYVSEDGAPFELWLENTHTSSGLYEGTFGAGYSFLSIARDAAGNTEPAKTTGEATTTVNLANQPPTLATVADITIEEGATVDIDLSGDDPDGPNSYLEYSVNASDSGMIVNPSTGHLRWTTTESHGGSSIAVTAMVSDGNVPPATASRTFNITVTDDNKSPVLGAFAQVVLEIDEAFATQVSGSDPDLPTQTLSYQIISDAPSGMTLDPATGELLWTPDHTHGGLSFEVEIEVSDDQAPALTARKSLLIAVLEDPGLPPEFDTIPAQVWQTGGSYELVLGAVDPEGSPVEISADVSSFPGSIVLTPAGSGKLRLIAHTTDIPLGIYEFPITAAADLQTSNAILTIEIIARAAFSDYESWTDAYGMVGAERDPVNWINGAGISNLMAYALGIDPIGGISPAQWEPRGTVIAEALQSGIAFQIPGGGRSDIVYRIDSTLDLITWDVLATKDGQQAWSVGSTVTEDVLSASLSAVTVWHSQGIDDSKRRMFRIVVESTAPPQAIAKELLLEPGVPRRLPGG